MKRRRMGSPARAFNTQGSELPFPLIRNASYLTSDKSARELAPIFIAVPAAFFCSCVDIVVLGIPPFIGRLPFGFIVPIGDMPLRIVEPARVELCPRSVA